MLESFKNALLGQYQAGLAMIEQCLRECPEDLWGADVGDYPFWHVAYHVLHYTDLYLSPDLDSYKPQEYCRENLQFFGKLPFPPFTEIEADPPMDRETLLAYVEHCRTKAIGSVGAETAESLAGPSGFWWYKIPRAEFHVNNVRHLQHHTGQLTIHLRRSAGIGIDWIGTSS